jgi:hypothetical protein
VSMRIRFVAAAALLAALPAHAVDYYNARITGIGISVGEDQIRFTIDADVNVIFTTSGFTGEQHKRVVALIYAAYAAQSPLYMIRSIEATSSPTPHYSQLAHISVEKRTWD